MKVRVRKWVTGKVSVTVRSRVTFQMKLWCGLS